MEHKTKYTCADYRSEMILNGLRQRLNQADLTQPERQKIIIEIQRLEAAMGMD
jgi:hypothetical protein